MHDAEKAGNHWYIRALLGATRLRRDEKKTKFRTSPSARAA